VRSHIKFGPDRFSCFDVYWIQTDKQTDRQAKYIFRLYNFQGLLNLLKPSIDTLDLQVVLKSNETIKLKKGKMFSYFSVTRW